MKVLLLGSGGREHALAWKISQSPRLTGLWCAPGNPGTAQLAENVAVKPDDPEAVVALAREKGVHLVVVGPEAPLVAGVADALLAAEIPVFGPVAAAANIEGSKAFAKDVMQAAGIPTAAFRVFDDDPAGAEAYAREVGAIVVKADGLAAGKGVVVARNAEESVAAVREISRLGGAAKRLVLEEQLEGEEVSVIALCDGDRYALLPPAQDHKRVGDGDTGPNTGGMGAYAPAPVVSEAQLEEIGRVAIAPALAELKKRGMPFHGALFAGLMMTPRGPRVLEFNARLGDPETQALMMQLGEDVLPLLHACAMGTLEKRPLKLAGGASVCVVLAAENYPQAPKTGDPIRGLDTDFGPDVQIFHAGVARKGEALVTSGGRVLSVCANGSDVRDARDKAYAALDRIHFRGMHFRRDIAARALRAR